MHVEIFSVIECRILEKHPKFVVKLLFAKEIEMSPNILHFYCTVYHKKIVKKCFVVILDYSVSSIFDRDRMFFGYFLTDGPVDIVTAGPNVSVLWKVIT